jgi:hypothetical protein
MKPNRASPEDIRYVCNHLRPESRREMFATLKHNDPDKLADEIIELGGLSWVFHHDGAPAYIIGCFKTPRDRWFAYGMATEAWRKVAFSVTKFVRRGMVSALRDNGCRLVESLCIADNRAVHAWKGILGCVRVCSVPGIGKNGEDFVLYARTI